MAVISFRDVHGIADELGVDVQTVRRWIQSGKLRAFKPGKEYRVREADLEEFLAAREVRPKAVASPSQRSLFNGEERRDPTLAELNAIETLKDYCDRLEEFLSEAKRTKIARTLWFMEADTAINMAALSLPLVEQDRLRPQLLPTAARLVQLSHEVFDGARNAGAVVPEDRNTVIDMVERLAS